jgi:pimeloyl-ACP methyl ester carboxylesterase
VSAAVDRAHIRTVDGVRLSVRVHPPTGDAAAPLPDEVAVVVVHGFGASADDEKVDAVMVALSGAGYTAITYDARGHGTSEGETTLGVLEQHDVAAAVVLAREYASRVVLVGTSMGGIAVLRHAAETTDVIAGVVTVACPAEWKLPRNVRGVLAALLVETGWGRSIARSRLGVRIAPSIDRGAPPAHVARAIAVPVAVVHGTKDPFIAVSAAELLHANVPGPSQLVVVEGLAHAFEPTERVTPAILDAVAWVLAHPGEPN